MGIGPPISPLFPKERAKPMPILGVWRGMMQVGAHDDARPASAKPPAEKPLSEEHRRGGCVGDSGTESAWMPMPSASRPSHTVGRFGTDETTDLGGPRLSCA